jgi:hypothetical protein
MVSSNITFRRIKMRYNPNAITGYVPAQFAEYLRNEMVNLEKENEKLKEENKIWMEENFRMERKFYDWCGEGKVLCRDDEL